MKRGKKQKLAIVERERLLAEARINLAGIKPDSPEHRETLRYLAEMLGEAELQSLLARATDAHRT